MRRIAPNLWALAVLSSVLQALSFPVAGPIPAWRSTFCWVALLPLLLALRGNDREGKPLSVRQTATLGYGCGVLWYLGNCYWIYQTMYLYGGLPKPIAAGILLLFAFYLGLYHALFGAAFGVVRNSRLGIRGALLLSPFMWVAVELARARITGFPWDLLGITLVDHAVITRLATFTGAYGLSFLIAAVNALFLTRIQVRERRYTRQALTAGGVCVVAAVVLVSYFGRGPRRIRGRNTATLIQENLLVGSEATGNRETPEELLAAFSKLSLAPPLDRCLGIPELGSTRCLHFEGKVPSVSTDLIVWPEAPSGFRTDEPGFNEALHELAQAGHVPLIIGSLGVVADNESPRGMRVYDSAALVNADGASAGRYDKIHLVPWGEYVPFREFFSFAERLTAGVGDMDRGRQRTIFRAGDHGIGVFVCYESIFGDEVRQFVRNGAEVLVNISDDGWYGDTGAAWQHLNMVRMRAIENRRWILRSTNTGVTAVIDPYGRVTAAAPRHIRTALHAEFNYERGMTFYTKHGDLFAYGCALVTVLALGYGIARRSTKLGKCLTT